MSAIMQFGFGQGDDQIGSRGEKYKGETNRTDRLSFAYWEGSDAGKPNLDAKTPVFVGAQRNYIEGVGYFINKGPEYTALAGAQPRMAIGTVVIQWPTDRKGTVDNNRLKEGEFKVLPWILGEDKYGAFGPIHGEFPLGSHDLMAACSDTKYQKMTFTPCQKNLFRMLYEKDPNAPIVQKILAQVQAVIANLANEIGRDLTLDQIRDKMSGGGGAGATGGGGSAAVSSATTQDIDNMVDSLLDE